MPRSCRDCGIGDWQDCACDDDAELDHPRLPIVLPPAERARIAALVVEPDLPPGVNGHGLRPKASDPGAAPQGDESPAPAADLTCADDDPDPARASSPARARGPVDDRRAA